MFFELGRTVSCWFGPMFINSKRVKLQCATCGDRLAAEAMRLSALEPQSQVKHKSIGSKPNSLRERVLSWEAGGTRFLIFHIHKPVLFRFLTKWYLGTKLPNKCTWRLTCSWKTASQAWSTKVIAWKYWVWHRKSLGTTFQRHNFSAHQGAS